MADTRPSNDFVRWFRDSSPYIHAHRGKTFVVYFGGEAVQDALFTGLIHDFALLNSLGIRLLLVHGIRSQIDQRMRQRGLESRYHRGLRITDTAALECVKEAAGAVRVEIEALFSTGLATSPMAGARLRVTSGNFVAAKPVGVRDGVDFQHTGEVRRVDVDGIRAALDRGDVVVLSAVGYSPTAEIYNLRSEEVATEAAIALKADKLMLLTEREVSGADDRLLRQLTTAEAQSLLGADSPVSAEVLPTLRAGVQACEAGVQRVHLLDRHTDGALLLELFSRDGIGTLVSRTSFEKRRAAELRDIPGILDLINPLESQGVLASRTRERIEMELDHYTVIERDGLVIGCAALHPYPEANMGELACVVLHPDYRGQDRGVELVAHIETLARAAGLNRLFLLTTHTSDWFREFGFVPATIDDLPEARRQNYNTQRNSKVLVKDLSGE